MSVTVTAFLFVIRSQKGWLSIPVHRCSMAVQFETHGRATSLQIKELGTRFSASGPVHNIERPDFIKLVGHMSGPNAFVDTGVNARATVQISVGVAHSPYRVAIEVPVARVSAGTSIPAPAGPDNGNGVLGKRYTSEEYELNFRDRTSTEVRGTGQK
jgi:hypothetical protein